MASATNRLYIVFRDNWGLAAKVAICVAAAVVDPSGAAVAAIRAAINALTGAKQTSASVGIGETLADTATDSPYEDSQDKMTLTFKDANGSYHTWRIPAPLPACFLENGDEVDLADSGVSNFVDMMFLTCVSKGGAALVTCTGGKRIRLNG